MKFLTCIYIFLSGVMVLSSCRTAEIVGYVHDPSGRFYKEKNFGADYLEKFKDEGIIFVLYVKKARENKYLLWLGLYSREKSW